MLSWSVLLVAVTLIRGQVMPARDAPLPVQGGASIKGRVVDAATKAPVSGARVRLNGPSPRGPVLTDDAGAFVFNGLNGGTYSFVVERNGYLPASWPDSSRWVRRSEGPVRLAANDNLEGLTLAIDKGGVVAGKVISATGEPISGAQLSLVGVVPPIYTTRNGMTNDLGDYRIADVPPGRYVLRAQLRTSSYNPPDTPLSGPLPTYYPGTLERREARELVVGRGGEVTEANLQLAHGKLSLLDVTVTSPDGSLVTPATLSVSSMTEPPILGFGSGGIRNGVARLELPPGEYILRAAASSGLHNPKDRSVYDLEGMARVRVASGTREAVSVIVGMSATASGRVYFEGDSAPPPAAAGRRIPMFASDGQTCRFGTATVAPDWSFNIDGLAGTCRSDPGPTPLSARWILKSVILDGREVLDENVWFEPGRHYENVRIVMTDRRSQVRVRVREANGTPTGEYAAVAFPVQPERWRSPRRYISAAAPAPPSFLGTPDRSGTGGEPGRSLRFIGLPAGDYYLIAVDDIEYTATHDPAVLQKLALRATRVTIPERDLIEVPLQRYLLSDLIR
jgi:hypothetical protein